MRDARSAKPGDPSNASGKRVSAQQRTEPEVGIADYDPFGAQPQQTPRVVARYSYCDEDGTVLFRVERIEPGPEGKPKTFRQRRPDGNGKWIGSVRGVRPVPYRLPKVVAEA